MGNNFLKEGKKGSVENVEKRISFLGLKVGRLEESVNQMFLELEEIKKLLRLITRKE